MRAVAFFFVFKTTEMFANNINFSGLSEMYNIQYVLFIHVPMNVWQQIMTQKYNSISIIFGKFSIP